MPSFIYTNGTAKRGMPDMISEMHADLCKTLGSPVRIEILQSLKEGEKTVGQICQKLGLRQANVSQHLAVLRQRRIVTTRREGTSIFYSISNPKFVEACGLIREVLLEQLRLNEKLTVMAGRGGTRRGGRSAGQQTTTPQYAKPAP